MASGILSVSHMTRQCCKWVETHQRFFLLQCIVQSFSSWTSVSYGFAREWRRMRREGKIEFILPPVCATHICECYNVMLPPYFASPKSCHGRSDFGKFFVARKIGFSRGCVWDKGLDLQINSSMRPQLFSLSLSLISFIYFFHTHSSPRKNNHFCCTSVSKSS